ncbi:class I SAM-dependent methyltransferase [Rectinema subterraneum]|nr:class I SAM-dependent methyltransferase [Rectinema subterraneum]
MESRRQNPIFFDRTSKEILDRIEYDFANLKIPRKTAVMLCIRAKKMDDYVKEFLASHPTSIVIHLGCGLDSRYMRVDNGEVEWYDLDMPEVIELRRKFYEETSRYRMISSSVNNLGWISAISAQGRLAMVIAEGLFMYLKEEEVKALILALKEAFPGCLLVFDAYSVLTARSVREHPSIKKTGAVIHWGIDDASAIEQLSEGIRLKEEWYFTQADDIKKLGFGFRLAFGIAGLFSAAKKAHRILYYSL